MRQETISIAESLLVLQCIEGDARAFKVLVGRWQPRLLGYAERVTGDAQAARDVVQETWMAIIKGLPGLDDHDAFPKWAFRIASNKCTDWLRGRIRRRKLHEQAAHEAPAAERTPDPRTEALDVVMAELDSAERALLSLYYLEGFNTLEISGILGIPRGTVKSRLYTARNRVRTMMEELNHE